MSISNLEPKEVVLLSDDLDRLRTSHIRWLNSFNKQIICNVSDDTFSESHKHCDFGQWYYSIQIKELSSDDEFKHIGNIHIKLHEIACDILEKHKNGNLIREEKYELFVKIEHEFLRAFDIIYSIASSTRYSIDKLTMLPNRSLFQSILEKEYAEFERNGGDHCLAFVDIDHFKSINDTYSHMAGDVALIAISRQMSKTLREYDSVGRYGGDEFLVSLPGTNLIDAKNIMERLRDEMQNLAIKVDQERSINVTCSLGLSNFVLDSSLTEIIKNADEALHIAKNNGRNKVEVFYK